VNFRNRYFSFVLLKYCAIFPWNFARNFTWKFARIKNEICRITFAYLLLNTVGSINTVYERELRDILFGELVTIEVFLLWQESRLWTSSNKQLLGDLGFYLISGHSDDLLMIKVVHWVLIRTIFCYSKPGFGNVRGFPRQVLLLVLEWLWGEFWP